MKWELDDNARSGFHYLVLGLLVIALPGLVISLIDMGQTAAITGDVHKLQVFRNGYLLDVPGKVTATFSSRGERVATGVLLACLGGAGVSGLLWLVGQRTRHWLVGRWVSIALLLYFAYASVRLPLRECEFSRSGIVMTRYSGIPCCDLPLPFTMYKDTIAFGADRRLSAQRATDHRTWRVLFSNGDRKIEIATSRSDSAQVAFAVEYLERISPTQ